MLPERKKKEEEEEEEEMRKKQIIWQHLLPNATIHISENNPTLNLDKGLELDLDNGQGFPLKKHLETTVHVVQPVITSE